MQCFKVIYEYDDQMGIISIYSNLKFYKFFAFRVLTSKAAGCGSSETACGGNREKERDGADTGPRLSQSKKLSPSWAQELDFSEERRKRGREKSNCVKTLRSS